MVQDADDETAGSGFAYAPEFKIKKGTEDILAMQPTMSRAKAEALGFNAKGGVMERAERIILLGLGLLFQALLVPILWVMLVLTAVTAVQRFVKVWRQASMERPVVASTRRAPRRRAARATSTAWRQNLQSRRRR